jgi:hypothetical protein
MTRVSTSRHIIVGGIPICAALLVLSSIDAQPHVRGALVLLACAGMGAAVASLQTGSAWRRVSYGVLTVEGAFFGVVLAWAGYWIASHGKVPILPQIVIPYVALLAMHHAALALTGGLVAVALPPAVRRIRAFVRPPD